MVNLTGELLLQLLDKIQIGFAFIDREGQVLYSNPQAVKMLGLAPGSPTNILYCHPSHSREQYKTTLQQLETRYPGTWHKTIRINNCWVQIYLARWEEQLWKSSASPKCRNRQPPGVSKPGP